MCVLLSTTFHAGYVTRYCETFCHKLGKEHTVRERGCLKTRCREKVAGSWRKPHNRELLNLYALASIIRVIKSNRIRWIGHVARIGKLRIYKNYWSEKQEGRHHSEDLGIDGKIILE
jgi:hypothetical protein